MAHSVSVQDSRAFGAVLTCGLLREAGIRSTLEWAGEFLSSHRGVLVGDVVVNNGYHVFDIPRSANLVRTLSRLLEEDFEIKPKTTWLKVEGHRFSSEQRFDEWPTALKKLVRGSKVVSTQAGLQDQLEQLLIPFGKRFSENWSDSRHLFLPWFLPPELIQRSFDEGEDFRRRVRQGSYQGNLAVFRDGQMETLRSSVFDAMVELEILIPQEKQLVHNAGSTEPRLQKPGDRFFVLALLELDVSLPQDWNRWDEVLFAESRAPDLNRMWIHADGHQSYAVLELYRAFQPAVTDEEADQLQDLVAETLGVAPSALRFQASKATRVLNVPEIQAEKKWRSRFQVSSADDHVSVTAVSLGTANMNKVWSRAELATQQVKAVLGV